MNQCFNPLGLKVPVEQTECRAWSLKPNLTATTCHTWMHLFRLHGAAVDVVKSLLSLFINGIHIKFLFVTWHLYGCGVRLLSVVHQWRSEQILPSIRLEWVQRVLRLVCSDSLVLWPSTDNMIFMDFCSLRKNGFINTSTQLSSSDKLGIQFGIIITLSTNS